MKKFLLLLLFVHGLFFTSFSQKIPLKAKNILNVSAKGQAQNLVDEQAASGDPKAGSTYQPTTSYQYNISGHIYYPLEVIIDLYAVHTITDLYFFDINASDSLIISTGSPGNWTKAVKTTTSLYMSWSGFPINRDTRYLHLEFRSTSSLITEVVLYGTAKGAIVYPPDPQPVVMKKSTVEEFLGINTLHDIPDTLQNVVKHLREYHNWGWDEGNGETYAGFPNNQYAWNPSWVSGTGWGWNFDAFYGNAKARGLAVSPDLQLNAPHLVNYDYAHINDKPVAAGKSTIDPFSYKDHADWMYQFSARYGSTTLPSGNLKVRSTNAALSGLNYISTVESWNEPDKNWEGRAGYFTPFELTAMLSADYDGHKGAMGNTFGVKNADPNMKLVMGGLTYLDTSYLRSMIFWAQSFRNGSFPADILNFHHYSNDLGGQLGFPSYSISPEQDLLKNRIATLVAFRNKYLPGKPIWISEFGYDTNTGSPQGVPVISGQTPWETQANWIIRSYLAIIAGGAERAHMFMLNDSDGSNPGMFASSGLVTAKVKNGGYEPYTGKNSWYYLYAFRKRLTGYVFKEEIASGNANVLIYAFQKTNSADSLVYAVWAPTSNNISIANYQLTLPFPANVSKVELTHKDTMGVKQAMSVVSGKVTFTVNEKPDLIIINKTTLTTGTSTAMVQLNASAYPNPCSSIVTIAVPDRTSDTYISVADVLGKTYSTFMAMETYNNINLEGYPMGVYLITISNARGSRTLKVVKQE